MVTLYLDANEANVASKKGANALYISTPVPSQLWLGESDHFVFFSMLFLRSPGPSESPGVFILTECCTLTLEVLAEEMRTFKFPTHRPECC